MRTPDTAHLLPEHAALVEELYLERWSGLCLGEAVRVRLAAHAARHAARLARRAG